MTFRTDRLLVFPMALNAVHDAFPALSDPQIYAYLDDGPPEDPTALERRWGRYLAGSGDPAVLWLNSLVREVDTARVIGWVQATVYLHRKTADIGYVLHPDSWGRGYGTEAVRALVEWLFTTYPLSAIEASVDTRNVRSQRLLERLGFMGVETARQEPAEPGIPVDYHYRKHRAII
jgi:RimJ/RimL family protein N-acetyltransferase